MRASHQGTASRTCEQRAVKRERERERAVKRAAWRLCLGPRARRDDDDGREQRLQVRETHRGGVLHPPLRRVGDDEDLAVGRRRSEQLRHDRLERRQLLSDLGRQRALLPLHHLEVRGAEKGVVPVEDGHRLSLARPRELGEELLRLAQLGDVPLSYVARRPRLDHSLPHQHDLASLPVRLTLSTRRHDGQTHRVGRRGTRRGVEGHVLAPPRLRRTYRRPCGRARRPAAAIGHANLVEELDAPRPARAAARRRAAAPAAAAASEQGLRPI